MDINDIDLTDRRVLVVGSADACRRAIARSMHAGAETILVAAPSAGPVSRSGDPAPLAVPFPAGPEEWSDLVATADLVVIVEVSAKTERVIRAACTRHRVLVARESAAPSRPVGHVTLVGGGPGDMRLLTVGAIEALRSADVVLFDRLGPGAHVADLAPGAELIDVGKTPGHHAVPQHEIERILVEKALAGNTVVRLKGGDPFVFGRGGEEVIACRAAGVPVTVLSGVTSAIAVPAAAGIPVTHREVSRMVTVVSGHVPLSEDELGHLVGLDSTIVVLMGVGTLPHLAAGLSRHGMRSDMPVAIVERGFSPHQRTTVGTVGTIVPTAARVGAKSPAVLVIGEVVRLADSADAEGLVDLVADLASNA